MPIPFIVWAIGLGGTALYGAYKGVTGASDISEANRMAQAARKRHASAVSALEVKRHQTFSRAQDYGRVMRHVRETTVRELAEFLVALQARPNMRELEVPADVEASVVTLSEYKSRIIDPPSDLLVAASAVGAGSAASASALGLVGLLGTAGTGTAISGLTGIAATNATMAWLGGGTLAAGGAGMAGGAVVLGGIAVAPALLIAGWVVAVKGEKQLTAARKYVAKADKAVAEVTVLAQLLGTVQQRVAEMSDVVQALDRRARATLQHLNPRTFDKSSDADMKHLTFTLQAVKALHEVMTTPVLDSSGQISTESGRVVVKYRSLTEGRDA